MSSNVRVAHIDHVGNQVLGRLAPAVERRLAIPGMPPAREVHFVDVDRRAAPVGLRAALQPGLVAPAVAIEVGHDGRRLRTQLHTKSEGIGFQQQIVSVSADLVLVGGALADAGHEQLPHARAATRLHGVLAAIPQIEVADHADAFRIRRPHREVHAVNALAHTQLRAELVIDAVVAAFAEQVQVEVRELVREEIGVVLGDFMAAAEAHAQAIWHQWTAVRDAAFENARFVDALELVRGVGLVVFPEHRHLFGAGLEHAHHGQRRPVRAREFVVAQQRARLVVRRLQERGDLRLRQLSVLSHRRMGAAPVS
jgi:hypothetical protein